MKENAIRYLAIAVLFIFLILTLADAWLGWRAKKITDSRINQHFLTGAHLAQFLYTCEELEGGEPVRGEVGEWFAEQCRIRGDELIELWESSGGQRNDTSVVEGIRD